MNLKCPNCSNFSFQETTIGKWDFTFWNIVVYFFGFSFLLGSQYKSNYDNYTNTHEVLFSLPMYMWGFLIIIIYTPYLIVKRKIHNNKYKRNIMYCSNCNYREDM